MDWKQIRYVGFSFIHLAQDRDRLWAVVNTVMNIWVPYKAGNFLTIWGNY
jgi:hypothetical protein